MDYTSIACECSGYCSLKELSAIVLVKGIVPDVDVIRKATEEGIPLLGTAGGTFDTAGKLFKILNG